jgi:4'-phosphopantetheinyl transferase
MNRPALLHSSSPNAPVGSPEDGEIHLWFSCPGKLSDQWLQSVSDELLPNDDLEKGRRYHFARDRNRFLLTRILQRTVLSRYHGVSPKNWQFSANPFGRPSIAASHGERCIEFNISHTNSLIVFAVGRDLKIGIDIEQLRCLTTQLEIADRFFGEVEASDLRLLPPHLRSRRFLEYWTLKEAYLKARGRGLSIPLDSVAFLLAPGRIDFTVNADQGDAERWRFLQFDVFDEHIGALCIGSSRGAPLRLTAREVVPYKWERFFNLEISRRSS